MNKYWRNFVHFIYGTSAAGLSMRRWLGLNKESEKNCWKNDWKLKLMTILNEFQGQVDCANENRFPCADTALHWFIYTVDSLTWSLLI